MCIIGIDCQQPVSKVVTLGEGLPKYTDTAALALIIGHEVISSEMFFYVHIDVDIEMLMSGKLMEM